MARYLPFRQVPAASLALLTALASSALLTVAPARAADVPKAIEQALATAQQEKKGVMLAVGGQSIGGGVLRIEPGQSVEMKSPQYGRIVVRLDRIDAVMMP
ncbi:MAG TPA: hypothetical protein PLF63_13720 [Rubrivivax sp.]|jgi:hypothetical protein|nr:hypothetical protein [Rubrivivax sp.]